MKANTIKLLGIFFLLGASMQSCKKYADGPAISLIPKKDRVANTWIVEKALADSQDVTSDYDQYEIYLTNDGDAQLTADYTVFGVTYTTATNGTWEFTNDESNIRFDYEDDSQDAEYQILKLTEKEFWLRKVGEELELQLKEK